MKYTSLLIVALIALTLAVDIKKTNNKAEKNFLGKTKQCTNEYCKDIDKDPNHDAFSSLCKGKKTGTHEVWVPPCWSMWGGEKHKVTCNNDYGGGNWIHIGKLTFKKNGNMDPQTFDDGSVAPWYMPKDKAGKLKRFKNECNMFLITDRQRYPENEAKMNLAKPNEDRFWSKTSFHLHWEKDIAETDKGEGGWMSFGVDRLKLVYVFADVEDGDKQVFGY